MYRGLSRVVVKNIKAAPARPMPSTTVQTGTTPPICGESEGGEREGEGV